MTSRIVLACVVFGALSVSAQQPPKIDTDVAAPEADAPVANPGRADGFNPGDAYSCWLPSV